MFKKPAEELTSDMVFLVAGVLVNLVNVDLQDVNPITGEVNLKRKGLDKMYEAAKLAGDENEN